MKKMSQKSKIKQIQITKRLDFKQSMACHIWTVDNGRGFHTHVYSDPLSSVIHIFNFKAILDRRADKPRFDPVRSHVVASKVQKSLHKYKSMGFNVSYPYNETIYR